MVNDKINDRLKVALADTGAPTAEPAEPVMPPVEEEKIVTTTDEWEAFYIVRAILREVADPKKVTIRDAQSYFAVPYSDNNRKPICRFYFNSKSK